MTFSSMIIVQARCCSFIRNNCFLIGNVIEVAEVMNKPYDAALILKCWEFLMKSWFSCILYNLLTYILHAVVRLEKLTDSQSRNSPHFMETESSLPSSQVPATSPYPEPARSSLCSPSHFLKLHFNIILPYMSGSSKCSISLRFPHQKPVNDSPLPHTCLMPCPSVTAAWRVLGLRMEERPPIRRVTSNTSDNRHGVFLQLGGWARC